MAAPEVGVCESWIDAAAVGACCSGLDPEVDPTTLTNAALMASNLLFRLTGRQFPGECAIVVRPCSSDSCNGCGDGGWFGGGWSFFWWNSAANSWASVYPFTSAELLGGFCGCAQRCQLSSVILPNPVASVSQVVIDGEELDSDAYRVVNFRRLERIDGGRFPCGQDFTRDSAEGSTDADGTWEITYTYGRGPGADGELYAAQLACQYALAMCGSESCVLPARTSRIVREGVSLELFDPVLLMSNGLTGLPMVDQWVKSVNPSGIARRAHFRRLGVSPNNYQSTT